MSEYKIDYDKRFKRFYYHKDGKVIGMSDILETLNYQQTKIAELKQAILDIDGGHSYNDTFLKIDEAVSLVNKGKL